MRNSSQISWLRIPSLTRLPGAILVLATAAATVAAQPRTGTTAPVLTGDVLYRMTLVRAAPGRYQDLLSAVRARVGGPPDPARGAAFRHSQGDQWDFLLLLPIAGTPIEKGAAGNAGNAWSNAILLDRVFDDAIVSWQEDEIVRGPALDVLPGFLGAGLYHFEMFDAAPGALADLLREREMENEYLAGVGRPRTLIFERVFGAAWDAFSLGAYRDWRHYAERDGVAPETARKAAQAAGFESDAAVGPYMRSLILSHHDTLATPVK
jgi:hypothetical protein